MESFESIVCKSHYVVSDLKDEYRYCIMLCLIDKNHGAIVAVIVW